MRLPIPWHHKNDLIQSFDSMTLNEDPEKMNHWMEAHTAKRAPSVSVQRYWSCFHWATWYNYKTSSQSPLHMELGQRDQWKKSGTIYKTKHESPTCAFSICSNDSNLHTFSNQGQTPSTEWANKSLVPSINTAAQWCTGSSSAVQKTERLFVHSD